MYDINEAEEYKIAEPGGQLDAFYQHADAMAADLGIPTEDALAMADQALGTKIASDILTLHAAAAVGGGYEDSEVQALEKMAAYLPPSGPYAGVQNYLNDMMMAYEDAEAKEAGLSARAVRALNVNNAGGRARHLDPDKVQESKDYWRGRGNQEADAINENLEGVRERAEIGRRSVGLRGAVGLGAAGTAATGAGAYYAGNRDRR